MNSKHNRHEGSWDVAVDELPGVQRRRLARVPCAFQIHVSTAEGWVEGTATNISLGGVFVAGVMVPAGRGVKVSLSLELGVVELEGESLGARALPNPGYGIRFTRLSAPALIALSETVGGRR